MENLAQKLYDSIPVSERKVSVAELEEKIIKAIEQGYGTCHCFMNLESEWENLPDGFSLKDGNFYCESINKESNQQFCDIEGINLMSMLFCKRGGIITARDSGQISIRYTVKELEISKNSTALSNTSIESATAISRGTQKKIQNLCNIDGVVYFDEDGFQRVKGTGLVSDPYLVAIAEYYKASAIAENVGDAQGYGAIFKVTFSSGKEIFVTMGDLKDTKDTKESLQKEGKNYYAGTGKAANTLEFFCNFLNNNQIAYSDNMTGKKGSDANMGSALTVTGGEEITSIGLLTDVEIEWENYFDQNDN